MSEMDIKKSTDLDFPRYATPAVNTKEIDLLGLLEVLFAAKKRIVAVTRHSAPDLGINLPIALTQYLQNDLLVSC